MIHRTIHQFTPTVRDEDAIGNEVFALHQMFRQFGFESRIWASRASNIRGVAVHRATQRIKSDDLLVIHYSHWSDDLYRVLDAKCRKILLYHNVTPDHFFKGVRPCLQEASARARAELSHFSKYVDCAVAHSSFSAVELHGAGYDHVLSIPYLLWEPSYAYADPRISSLACGHDGRTLLAVGRIAPHKRLELTLLTLDYLVRYVDPRWRLILVGGAEDFPVHLLQLRDLARDLPSHRIIFTGHVTQPSLVGYYQLADAFICMSDHEGFGVPLVEAMRFDLPVFARNTSAVPETVNGAGVLFPPDADVPLMAETIQRGTEDDEQLEHLIARQRRRLRTVRPHQVVGQWQKLISSICSAPGHTPAVERSRHVSEVFLQTAADLEDV
jgi:glycosyltransferase involved in cell wall biosynthesis